MTLLTRRRIVGQAVELSGAGTYQAVTASTDALVTLRSASISVDPVRVDRPTLRGNTLTKFPSIFPGQARFEVVASFELHGDPSNTPAADDDDYNPPPTVARAIQAAGFSQKSGAGNCIVYSTESEAVTNGPFRHGETVTQSGGGGGPAVVIGDLFNGDDLLYLDETAAITGASVTITGSTSGATLTTFNANTRRAAGSVIGWQLRSDTLNATTLSVKFWNDGKAYAGKGCATDIEFQFRHGDAVVAQVTYVGVYEAAELTDEALPTDAKSAHYVPPTFLGSEVTIVQTAAVPKSYGSNNGSILNSSGLSQITLRTGNELVLRENALDPNGFTRAFIADRSPTGTFDPDEVLESEFEFIEEMVNGRPMHANIQVGGDGAAANDGNTFQFRVPGMILTGLGDGERDGIHAWDGSFDITGGNYDYDAGGDPLQQEESPGTDNELTIFYR